MSIDIEQLSAKDLFELANRKLQQEKEEALRSEMAARVVEARKRQQQEVAAHEKALAALDKELALLQQRREQLIAAHQEKLAAIDTDVAGVVREGRAPCSDSVAPIPAPTSPHQPVPAPKANRTEPGDDELASAILEAMKGRNDISDSLLREKLRLKGMPLGDLGKQMEKLVREGKVISKGGGNYALKKK